MSVKLDPRGPHATSPLTPDGTLRPERLALARRLVDALPADIARLIASENARRIYRLDHQPR